MRIGNCRYGKGETEKNKKYYLIFCPVLSILYRRAAHAMPAQAQDWPDM